MNYLTDLGKGIKAGVVNITPEQAEKMLEKNTNNRAIKKAKISQYALDMTDGLWQFNAMPIIFNGNNDLLDGQNRLHAIIRSGVAQEMLIVSGISRNAFQTIDTGANRTGRDILSIYGVECDKAGYLTSLIQRIHNLDKLRIGVGWDKGAGHGTSSTFFTNQRCKLPNQLILDYYKQHHRELDEVYEFCAKYKVKVQKVYAFPLYLLTYRILRKLHIQDAQEFCGSLATGELLSSGDPAYALREKLIQVKNSETEKLPGWHYPALIFKAWNSYRRRQPLQRLFVASSEKAPVKPI